MRVVMALSSQGSMSLAARIEIRARSPIARRQRVKIGALPCGGDTDEGGGFLDPRCCLGLERDDPFRTAGKDEQASAVSTFGGPTRPEKPAPSLL
jgi:hypothetical protein